MNPIDRVKDILLKPDATWSRIAGEGGDIASIYKQYLIFLAAIPAVCGFIGLSLIGASVFGVTVRVPIVSGLVNMVLSYVLGLVGVFVLSLVINALAPTFGGRANSLAAFKVAAYGSTASMVGGVFQLIPMLGVLGIIAALYSLYLVYLGLPVLMGNPREKSVVYTVVVAIAGFVVSLVIGLVGSIFMPAPSVGGSGAVSLNTPGGEVRFDTAKLEAAGRQMEHAARQMEQAQKSGDPVAVQQAAGAAMASAVAATGVQAGAALSPAVLKAALPAALGAYSRDSIESQGGQAMGIAASSASARYVKGDKAVEVSLSDVGGASALAALAGLAQGEQEDDTSAQKMYQRGGRSYQESWEKDGSHAEVMVVLKNGVTAQLQGEGVPIADLRALADKLDLATIESAARATR